MKLLVGLGNPGSSYEKNRHNVGFMFVDSITSDWRMDKKKHAEISESDWKGEKTIVLKPQTFMNESGKAVASVVSFYKLNVSDIFVVHDDLDIVFGEWKRRLGKGPKIHNGLISIEKSLGTVDFWRIRIGVDGRTPENRVPGDGYVLSDFTEKEFGILQKEVFPAIKKSA